MLRFEHPEYLNLLLIVLPLLGIFLYAMNARNKAFGRFAEQEVLARLFPDKPAVKHQIKFGLSSLALILLIFALANPQLGRSFEKVKREGVDLMIALDISNSMLAEDEKPNRISKARQFVSRLIDKLSGDRVGLIIFAGNAYLQVPLTSDYTAAKTFLRTISTNLAPTQGTAIGAAIKMADESFSEQKSKHKTLLLISDGENHEGQAIEAASAASENGMTIYTVGIGSPAGAPIPIRTSGGEDYMRDRTNNNNIVHSRLNETMLQQVAAAGGGKYLKLIQGNSEISTIISELESMEQQEFEERVVTDFEDQYQWLLAFAILLISIDFFVSERKNSLFADWKIFQVNNP